QLDVRHALAAHLRLGDLDPALLADHTAVLQALVLPAKAFVVLDRPEYLGAEQPVALRLEGPVVDRFRLLDLAERPRPNHVRRSQPDADRIEVVDGILVLKKFQKIFHQSVSNSMLIPSDRISLTSTLKDSG